MKLLFCQDCGDIIAPYPRDDDPRWCSCERHAVWWVNSMTGALRLYDRDTPPGIITERKYPPVPRAFVIGITNSFLMAPETLNAETIEKIIDGHSDYYLFKRQRSCIIRIRPGESSDTAWAALPS